MAVLKNFGRIVAELIKKTKGMSMTGILITLTIVALATALGIGSQYYWGDDNAVEEAAEDIIQQQTGLQVDLSPSSKEKK